MCGEWRIGVQELMCGEAAVCRSCGVERVASWGFAIIWNPRYGCCGVLESLCVRIMVVCGRHSMWELWFVGVLKKSKKLLILIFFPDPAKHYLSSLSHAHFTLWI